MNRKTIDIIFWQQGSCCWSWDSMSSTHSGPVRAGCSARAYRTRSCSSSSQAAACTATVSCRCGKSNSTRKRRNGERSSLPLLQDPAMSSPTPARNALGRSPASRTPSRTVRFPFPLDHIARYPPGAARCAHVVPSFGGCKIGQRSPFSAFATTLPLADARSGCSRPASTPRNAFPDLRAERSANTAMRTRLTTTTAMPARARSCLLGRSGYLPAERPQEADQVAFQNAPAASMPFLISRTWILVSSPCTFLLYLGWPNRTAQTSFRRRTAP